MVWAKSTFATNLRYYMESRGKTQKEIAEIAEVSAPTVTDWLKARKYPRIDRIERIADYFGILKSDLIEDKKSPQAEAQGGDIDTPDDVRKIREELIASINATYDMETLIELKKLGDYVRYKSGEK